MMFGGEAGRWRHCWLNDEVALLGWQLGEDGARWWHWQSGGGEGEPWPDEPECLD